MRKAFVFGCVAVCCFWICQLEGASLLMSRLLGGGGTSWEFESAYDVAVDKQGFIYLTGQSTANMQHSKSYGPEDGEQVFVVKLDPAGTEILYSTLLAYGRGRGIAVNDAGEAYITGETWTPLFPATPGGQQQFGGGTDAFVAKLDPNGNLVFAQFFGGTNVEMGTAIGLDKNGDVLVTGMTFSTDLKVTANAASPTLGGRQDAFLLKLNADGSQKLLATYMGGTENKFAAAMAVGQNGAIYLTGRGSTNGTSTGKFFGPGGLNDVFLAQLNPDTGEVEWLDHIGGEDMDAPSAIALDKAGNIYVGGETASTQFPVTAGALKKSLQGLKDNFVLKVDPTGQNLIYSTYLGGREQEYTTTYVNLSDDLYQYPIEKSGLCVNDAGEVYFMAGSSSSSFGNAGSRVTRWGCESGVLPYVAKLSADGSTLMDLVMFGSWENSEGRGMALNGPDTVTIAGYAGYSPLPPFFPTTGNISDREYHGNVADIFVTKINLGSSAATNDNRSGATVVTGKVFTEASDNTAATAEPGEPAHGSQPAAHSLWWKWVAQEDGKLAVNTGGSTFDTTLSIYMLQANGEIQSLAENDDLSPDRVESAARVAVQKGKSYLIAVDGKNGGTGQVMLSFMFSNAANDDFADAQLISGYPASATGTNVNSSRELSEPYHFYYGRNSIWWKWTAPKSEGVSISTEGSDFPALIAVYTGTELVALEQKVAYPESVNFLAEAGQTYYIATDSSAGQTGTVKLTVKKGEPPANDNFADTVLLEGWSVSTLGTNVNATVEAGEANLFTYTDSAGKSVWYKWISPTNGFVAIDTKDSNLDTKLTVFQGSALENLRLVAENDQGYQPPSYASRVLFRVATGAVYFIRINSSIWNSAGVFNLNLNLTQPPEIDKSSFAVKQDGTISFEVIGVAGHSYYLQKSSDLVNWTRVSDTLYSGERITITQPRQTAGGAALYRLEEKAL